MVTTEPSKTSMRRQANWREIPFAGLIVFILVSPLSAAYFVYGDHGMFIYTAALVTVGLILSASGSRWLTVAMAAGILSPVLGFITLTEMMFLFGRFIRI